MKQSIYICICRIFHFKLHKLVVNWVKNYYIIVIIYFLVYKIQQFQLGKGTIQNTLVHMKSLVILDCTCMLEQLIWNSVQGLRNYSTYFVELHVMLKSWMFSIFSNYFKNSENNNNKFFIRYIFFLIII